MEASGAGIPPGSFWEELKSPRNGAKVLLTRSGKRINMGFGDRETPDYGGDWPPPVGYRGGGGTWTAAPAAAPTVSAPPPPAPQAANPSAPPPGAKPPSPPVIPAAVAPNGSTLDPSTPTGAKPADPDNSSSRIDYEKLQAESAAASSLMSQAAAIKQAEASANSSNTAVFLGILGIVGLMALSSKPSRKRRR